MGLLDLVEQQDAEGPGAHSPRQFALGVLGGSDESGGRLGVGEFTHVEPYEPIVGAEQFVGERLGRLGLADAGRPDQKETPVGASRIGQIVFDRDDQVGDGFGGLGLIEDARLEGGLDGVGGASGVVLENPHREAGLAMDDLGDGVGVDASATSIGSGGVSVGLSPVRRFVETPPQQPDDLPRRHVAPVVSLGEIEGGLDAVGGDVDR